MATIDNRDSYTLVSGTNDTDSIYNSGENVTIQALGGDDTIRNSNDGNTATIDGGDGNDYIDNSGTSVIVVGGQGNDTIDNSVPNVTIDGGVGNDTIRNNNGAANNVTISGGEGNDRIGGNLGSNVSINGGLGDDIINTGLRPGGIVVGYELEENTYFAKDVTINGGAGNDIISLQSAATGNVIQYTLGDGSDTVYGFHSAAILTISGSGHTSVVSGNNIIVTVDDGNTITLIDAATSANALNIVSSGGENVIPTGGENSISSGGENSISSGGENDSITTDKFTLESTTNYNGHDYYLISTTVESGAEAWDDANSWLNTNYGAHLAIINDEAENQALFNFINAKTTEAYFGLTDAGHEGTWTWVDGSPLTYSNVADGEPNGSTYENYGMFYGAYPDGKWNDGDLDLTRSTQQKLYFIGESDNSTTPAPTPVVEPLAPVRGNAAYDIVFLIDNTGSMGDYVNNVKENIPKFVEALTARNVDYRLGLISFGDIAEENGQVTFHGFTTDKDAFANNVNSILDNINGGVDIPESGLEALVQGDQAALSMIDVNDGRNKKFIVVTDADFHNQGDSELGVTGDPSTFLATEDVIRSLQEAGVSLDVIGKKNSDCEKEWTALTSATDGNFYDIEGNYAETFSDITGNFDQVNVNLAEVADGQTGKFFIPIGKELDTANGVNAIFASAENYALNQSIWDSAFELVGEVTADKVYNGTGSRYRQNIGITDGWNVTATKQNDILDVNGTGFGVIITSGAGHDVVNLGEFATGVILADHDLAQDGLSFATRQLPGTFIDNPQLFGATEPGILVALSSPTMNIFFNNVTQDSTTFEDYIVFNGNKSNTVHELIYGEDNPSDSLGKMQFAYWSYNFTPPESNTEIQL